MNRILTLAVVLLLAAGTSSPGGLNRVGCRDKLGSSIPTQDVGEGKLKAFVAALQKAVGINDRVKVASMIRYPIVIVVDRRSVLFETPAQLAASYDRIFTTALKKLIAETKAEDMSSNWRGAMMGGGDIWIHGDSAGHLKIVTIQSVSAEEEKAVKPRAPALKVHPRVFSLIGTDSEVPEVTEVNLDAFLYGDPLQDKDVQQVGEWIRYSRGKGEGFTDYRVVKVEGNRYTVEVRDNGGGTLTTSAIVDFVVEKRAIRQDGKLKNIRVLKVLGFRAT
jgi:hypothetical protein